MCFHIHTVCVLAGFHTSRLPILPLRARVIAASFNLLLTVYSTFIAAIVKLLHCVSVPGQASGSFLFIQGGLTCEYLGWQLPFVVLLAALVAVPLLLPLLSRWSLKGGRSQVPGT